MSPTSSPPGKQTPKDAKGRGTGGIRGRGGQRGHLAGLGKEKYNLQKL